MIFPRRARMLMVSTLARASRPGQRTEPVQHLVMEAFKHAAASHLSSGGAPSAGKFSGR